MFGFGFDIGSSRGPVLQSPLVSTFAEQSLHWAAGSFGSPAYRQGPTHDLVAHGGTFDTVPGVGSCYRPTTGIFDFAPVQSLRVRQGYEYFSSLRVRAITDDADAEVWIRWIGLREDYSAGEHDFKYLMRRLTVADGWVNMDIVASPADVNAILALGFARLRPNVITNIVGDGQVFEIQSVTCIERQAVAA